MGIVASTSKTVQEALGRLHSELPAEREAAVARLTLIGRRAISPLSKALRDLPSTGKLAALEVFDRLGDKTAIPAVLACLGDRDSGVSTRAAAALTTLGGPEASRALADRLRGEGLPGATAAALALGELARRGSIESLDSLLAAAMDNSLDDPRRLAALSAVAPAAGPELRRVLERLARGPAPRLAAEAAARLAALEPRNSKGSRRVAEASGAGSHRARELVSRATAAAQRGDSRLRWLAALEAEGPDALEALHASLSRSADPETTVLLAEAAGRIARPASIPVLRDLLARLPDGPEGLRVAAAAHTALAALDSRVALTDLRIRMERSSGPTAAALVRAAGLLGDASFGAALSALSAREPELEPSCAAAFRAIASRHRVTRRSRAIVALPAEARASVQRWLTASTKSR